MKYIIILLSIWHTLDAATYTNPIVDHGPDPWMQEYEGNYYYAASTFSNKITMRKSKTLGGIHSAAEQTILNLNATTGCCVMWAPEFHLLTGPNGKRWYLYYTAGKQVSDYVPTQRIHVLESEGLDPLGPYHYKGDFVDPKDDSSFELDASILQHGGKLYLMGTYLRGRQDLFIRPLSNPYTASGSKVTLSQPTNSWETQGGAVNEGPEPLYHDGKTMIVYSASYCVTPDYSLGLLTLTGTDPLNPSHWTKHNGAVFKRLDSANVFGPGHNGFFMSPDGKENWIVYHANNSTRGSCDMNRSSRAQKFTWNSDGTPNFGNPVATGTALQGPSGE